MTSIRWLFLDVAFLLVLRRSHGCGSTLVGEGNITSPNYPDTYPSYANCRWNLTASPGKVLLLFCRSFDLEDKFDYLRVTSEVANKTSTYYYYSLTGSSSNCSWILGPTASVTFTSDSSIHLQGFALGFRSVVPGSVNRTAFTACGGRLNGSGVITSPNYPGNYPGNAFCVWYITAQGGNQLRFSTSYYNLEARYDYVKIYDSPTINKNATIYDIGSSYMTLLGYAFGGHFQTGPAAVVVFSTDGSFEKGGFSLNFKTDLNYNVNGSTSHGTNNFPLNNGCGESLNGEGNITTPGYPSFFPPLSSCFWFLTAANGSAIVLDFLDFALDKGNSYLYITDSSGYQSYSFSGSDSNMTSMRLPSQISLRFVSQSDITNRGFSIRFKSVAISNGTNTSFFYSSTTFTSCGANLTNQGNFTSPHYPAHYPNVAYCTWQLRASSGKILQLQCFAFDTEKNADIVFVTSQAYNKTSISYNWFTGDCSSLNMNLGSTATVLFTSDNTVRRQGFVFGFRSINPTDVNMSRFTTCGGRLSGSGIITSPNFPGTYPSNSYCVWNITALGGNQLKFSISSFNLEATYDYVKIYDSPHIYDNATIYNIGSSFVSVLGITVGGYFETGPAAVVVFSSDSSIERNGFSLNFWSDSNYVSSISTGYSYSTPSTFNNWASSSPYYRDCGSNLIGEGNFTTPYYPNNYPSNANCTWNLSATPGKVLQLFCRFFDLENYYDYLYVTSKVANKTTTHRLTGSSSNCSWILGPTAVVTFTSDYIVQLQGFVLGFRSIIPPTVNRTAFSACGGQLQGSGTIRSPNFPGSYPGNAYCVWNITARGGNQLMFSTSFYNLESTYDYVRIYDSPQINENATFYDIRSSYVTVLGIVVGGYFQTGPVAIVVFSSDGSIEQDGFSLNFWSDSNNVGSVSMSYSYSTPSTLNSWTSSSPSSRDCGNDLTGEGNITTPYYPNQYPSNANCTWNLSATPGKVLQLFCRSFHLENSYDYLYVRSQVANKTTTYQLTGSSSNCSWILGPTALVIFTSDHIIQLQGFALGFRSIIPPAVNRTAFSACGGQLNGSGIITSPNYPNRYPSNAYCVWNITAKGGNSLRFTFESYDIENLYDFIMIYNSSQINENAKIFGNGSLMWWWWWSGGLQTGPNAVIVLYSDASVEQSGFSIRFWSEWSYIGSGSTTFAPLSTSNQFGSATSGYPMSTSYYAGCGGYLHGEGNITTPGYPNNFPTYSSCSWTITAANGLVILLEFLDFALDKQNSNLYIWDTMVYNSYYLSGTDSNVSSLRFSSQVSLHFSSYGYVTSRGFSIRFKSVVPLNTTNSSFSYNSNFFTSCGSNLIHQGNLTSPNYPAQYPNSANCLWNISASPGNVLQLFCVAIDLESNYDYVYVTSQVYNKTTFIYNWLNGNSSNCSMNLGTSATIRFSSDATVRRQGFVLGFRSVPPPSFLNRTTFTQCGGNLSGSGFLSSPNYPDSYPRNSRCTWKLRALDGQALRLNFYSYDVEETYDSLLIYNSANVSKGVAMNYTSYWQQNMHWMQFNSEVFVVFTSDESVERQGFQIYFYSEYPRSGYSTTTTAPSVGCGGDIYIEGVIYSPSYPNQYPSSTWCLWSVFANSGSLLVIEFVDLDTIKGSDYLSIYTNGSGASYGGKDLPRPIRGGSYAYIQFGSSSLTNGTLPKRGFKIRIYSINSISNSSNFTNAQPIDQFFTSCGGNFTGKGNLTSPGYPALYPNKAACSYSLTAQSPGDNIVLTFTTFDLEANFDYLYIYGWTNSYYYYFPYHWFTGSNLPSTLVLPNNASLWFTSDTTVRGKGFFASFYSVPGNSTYSSATVTRYPTVVPSASLSSGITTKPSTMSKTTQKTTPTTKLTTVLSTKSTTQRTSTVPRPLTCGGILYSKAVFASPNYPASYPNNAICNWTLVASPGRVVLVSFQYFALESDADYLRIYNGTEISWRTPFISYTGFSVPPQLYLTESVSVIFTSDDLINFAGFKANFTSVIRRGANSTNISSTATPYVCGGSLKSSGEIMSPNFPYAYPNNASCIWTFSVQAGGAYRFEFLNFSTEEFWDYVVIRAGAVQTTRFSGSQIPSVVVIVRNGSISFTSDESVQNSGFRIRYSRLSSVTTSRTTVRPTSSSLGACGVAIADLKVPNSRIIGGYDAPSNSAPWHVLISRGSTKFGGVLLNSRWVLTAASNLKYSQASTYNLLFGKQRQNVQDAGQMSAEAISIIKYPGYNESTSDGDIALLKIGTSVSFTTRIRPVCLPSETVQAGQVCYATGYGSGVAGVLKVARVTIIEKQDCFNYVNPYSKNRICGGYIGGGEDVCKGDTGGPLVCFNKGLYELQGITSSQASCGRPFSPSVFTAVAPYMTWINSIAK